MKFKIQTAGIDDNSTEFFYMDSVCRQETMDVKIKKFLDENKKANVVFLGAGLETSYNRIGNKTANFYQLDLPDVMELRKRVLGNAENEKLISGDMFELEWIKEIDTSLPTLISVAGVYEYFNEDKIVDMIKKMKAQLPNGELIFDATNSKGLEYANKYVKKTGNKNAQMYFRLDNPIEFANKTHTELISVDGFFKDALKTCKNLKFKTKIYMYFADKLKRTMIIHLGF